MSSLLARALAVAAVGLAVGAASAQASGFTLGLSAPPAVVVGKPIVLDATGTIPVDQIQYPYWFSLDAIPTTVTTTCPADRWAAAQFANATGSVIVLSQRETPDAVGQFTVPVAIKPTAPGTVLLCGYTDDGMTNTLARASLLLDIAPAPAARRPSPPAELRSAMRGCHALLGGAAGKRCVRTAVKRARAGCRRYASHRREARCLHQVRKVARRSR
jgi:hypothetical protein